METKTEKLKRLAKLAAKKGLYVRNQTTIVLPNDTTYDCKDLADMASFIRDY